MRRVLFVSFLLAFVVACSRKLNDVYVSAYEGKADILFQYLRNGGDPNAVSASGQPLLILACGPHGSLEAVKVLIEGGANVNGRDGGNGTALMEAASWVNGPSVRYLLHHGADPNIADGDGKTALMLVGWDGGNSSLKVIKLLVAHGAKVNVKDNSGRSVVDHIRHISAGNDEAVTYLKTVRDGEQLAAPDRPPGGR